MYKVTTYETYANWNYSRCHCGFNAANADPLPTSAQSQALVLKKVRPDLGIAGKVAAIERLAMDNTAVWQMGNSDQANVLINPNTSGVTDGHVALVNTHASYKSDVVIEQKW
ncbi:hypothetical protein O9992_13750 [Vibrio lentus]|nr:hypothetical protein [Vibrio lentus]